MKHNIIILSDEVCILSSVIIYAKSGVKVAHITIVYDFSLTPDTLGLRSPLLRTVHTHRHPIARTFQAYPHRRVCRQELLRYGLARRLAHRREAPDHPCIIRAHTHMLQQREPAAGSRSRRLRTGRQSRLLGSEQKGDGRQDAQI